MRSRLIYILLFIAIIIAVLYSPLVPYLLKDFITSRMEKALDMTIVFGEAHFEFPSELTVSNIKALDKNGAGVTAKRAYLQLDIPKIVKGYAVLDCKLKSVGVGSGLASSLNGLLKPLGVPAQDIYNFDSINAIITIKRDFFEVRGLNAVGPNFKILGEFSRLKDKKVDYNMEFKINKQVLAGEEGRQNRLLMDEDAGGWYSVKLSVKGDPRKPSNISFSTGGVKLEVKSAPAPSD